MALTLDEFLTDWTIDTINARKVFESWHAMFQGMPGVECSFKSRPGISHSLRLASKTNSKRPLFALIDVVDDDPDNRWLSVCFYADLVTDPEGLGDIVPAGLEGEDAICFNLDDDNGATADYIRKRLQEAAANAA